MCDASLFLDNPTHAHIYLSSYTKSQYCLWPLLCCHIPLFVFLVWVGFLFYFIPLSLCALEVFPPSNLALDIDTET